MNVFIIGITGGIGSALAEILRKNGNAVHGLVRREEQQAALASEGVRTKVGDLSTMTTQDLAAAFGDADAIVFSTGSNGGDKKTTKALDGDGVEKAMDAARIAGNDRFVLVSVFPESWRERDLGDDLEYYFAVKKEAELALTRSDLDWLILRPSLLLDTPATGTVSLGPVGVHNSVARRDVANTLAALLDEPLIRRQILELDSGPTPIAEAVRANVPRR